MKEGNVYKTIILSECKHLLRHVIIGIWKKSGLIYFPDHSLILMGPKSHHVLSLDCFKKIQPKVFV